MDATTRLLAACRRQPVDRPPVWLMRQAGRYMPSYRAVRARVSFLELCRTPELACEVTLQPVDQLGVDAAILFSDIMIPLEPMGANVDFNPGPIVEPPIRDAAAVAALRTEGAADELDHVYDAVRLIVRELDGRVPLLGFAGAPLTLAAYLIEGKGSRHHHELKRLMYAEPAVLESLLDKVATVISQYLRRQIEAGCAAVQLFDTWGGTLDEARWRRFSMRYTARIMREIADTGAPLIHYTQNGAHLLGALGELPCDVLSVDWRQPMRAVREATGGRYAIQGNADPGLMRAPLDVVRREAVAMLDSYGGGPGLIANLGHGLTPDASVDAVRAFVEAIQEHGPAYGG